VILLALILSAAVTILLALSVKYDAGWIISCPICGSEKRQRRKCANCKDMAPTEYWIDRALSEYLQDKISLEQFEFLVGEALRNPRIPNFMLVHMVYR
jgi:hypothetical protein